MKKRIHNYIRQSLSFICSALNNIPSWLLFRSTVKTPFSLQIYALCIIRFFKKLSHDGKFCHGNKLNAGCITPLHNIIEVIFCLKELVNSMRAGRWSHCSPAGITICLLVGKTHWTVAPEQIWKKEWIFVFFMLSLIIIIIWRWKTEVKLWKHSHLWQELWFHKSKAWMGMPWWELFSMAESGKCAPSLDVHWA